MCGLRRPGARVPEPRLRSPIRQAHPSKRKSPCQIGVVADHPPGKDVDLSGDIGFILARLLRNDHLVGIIDGSAQTGDGIDLHVVDMIAHHAVKPLGRLRTQMPEVGIIISQARLPDLGSGYALETVVHLGARQRRSIRSIRIELDAPGGLRQLQMAHVSGTLFRLVIGHACSRGRYESHVRRLDRNEAAALLHVELRGYGIQHGGLGALLRIVAAGPSGQADGSCPIAAVDGHQNGRNDRLGAVAGLRSGVVTAFRAVVEIVRRILQTICKIGRPDLAPDVVIPDVSERRLVGIHRPIGTGKGSIVPYPAQVPGGRGVHLLEKMRFVDRAGDIPGGEDRV